LIPFDGISMSGLAHRFGLDNSTLTRNIQKLENLGLVERLADSYDRRIQRVILTNKGISLLESLEDHLKKQNTDILEMIDLDTQEHLTTVLEQLSWALNCSRE
jgi:DNA-binding MarR family transcriptional regulator